MMPSVIYPGVHYHTDLIAIAWAAAGWACAFQDEELQVWGPPSIAASIDDDVLELSGCVEAKL